MLQAFIDDSGRGQAPVFVLAGFLSTIERWAEFTESWHAELKREPSIAYLKAKEAADCRGQFKGWGFDARDRKMEPFVALINDTAVAAVVVTVYTDA